MTTSTTTKARRKRIQAEAEEKPKRSNFGPISGAGVRDGSGSRSELALREERVPSRGTVYREGEEEENNQSFHLSTRLNGMGGARQQTGGSGFGCSSRHSSSSLIMPLLLLIVSSSFVYGAPTRGAQTQTQPQTRALGEQQLPHQAKDQQANQLLVGTTSASSAAEDSIPFVVVVGGGGEKIPQPATKFPPQAAESELENNKQAAAQAALFEEELRAFALALNQLQDEEQASSSSSSPLRRLVKRSGISDQRLAEIQMIRALKKQLERASKLASTQANSESPEVSSS